MSDSFRSSGILTKIIQQADGRWELVTGQVNVLPISAADAGNMEVVAQMAIGTHEPYDRTMADNDIVQALRDLADTMEQRQQ